MKIRAISSYKKKKKKFAVKLSVDLVKIMVRMEAQKKKLF